MWGIAVLCGNLKLETSSGMHAPLVGATLPAAGIAMRYPNSAGSQCWVHHRSACWTCMRICAALRTSFFFRGRRQGRQPLNIIMNMRVWLGNWSKKHGDQLAKYWTFDEFWFRKFRKTWFHRTYPKIDVHFFKFMAPKKTPNGYRQERRFADVQILWFVKQNGDFTTKWTGACGSGSSVGLGGGSLAKSYRNYFIAKQ